MNLNAMLGMGDKKVLLASGSPRRKQLLELIGMQFEVRESGYDEDSASYALPEVHVLELSEKKAAAVAENITKALVIGADTIVVLRGEILGKPRDPGEAKTMLKRLSGKTHTVYTGFAIMDLASGRVANDYEKTEVSFRTLSDVEIDAYVATSSPLDKAGAYGIQDTSAVFVSRIEGCFYNVVGFPLTKFYTSLCSILTDRSLI